MGCISFSKKQILTTWAASFSSWAIVVQRTPTPLNERLSVQLKKTDFLTFSRDAKAEVRDYQAIVTSNSDGIRKTKLLRKQDEEKRNTF